MRGDDSTQKKVACDIALIELLLTSKEPIWMTKIVEKLTKKYKRIEVLKTVDKLEDLYLIYSKYEKVGKWWTNCYHVDDDLAEQLGRMIGVKVKA